MWRPAARDEAAVRSVNPAISQFDCSCFDGIYVTGDVTAEYLESVETARGKSASAFQIGRAHV